MRFYSDEKANDRKVDIVNAILCLSISFVSLIRVKFGVLTGLTVRNFDG